MTRHTIASALLAAGLAALPLYAASQAPAQKPATAAPGMGAGQMDTEAMADQMKKMQAQMDRIRQTTDPKEREKLLAEHMQSMQETMQKMRGMGGGMMMRGGMGGGGTAGGMGGGMAGGMMGGSAPKGGARPPSTDQRMQMMENRMDMMQMMMEQMMQREQLRQPGTK